MDGLSQSDHINRERVIKTWMLTIIDNGGIDRFDDLHINRIAPEWSSRNKWIEGALSAFSIALHLKKLLHIEFSVVLAFALSSGKQQIGLNFSSRQEFIKNLAHTPPSLYLQRIGQEFWRQSGTGDISDLAVREFNPKVLDFKMPGLICHFMEFKRLSVNEYSRSVFAHQ